MMRISLSGFLILFLLALAPSHTQAEPYLLTVQQLKASMDSKVKKSPSQRLRGVMYLNFKKDPRGYEDFDSYYEHFMEAHIENWKSHLDEY